VKRAALLVCALLAGCGEPEVTCESTPWANVRHVPTGIGTMRKEWLYKCTDGERTWDEWSLTFPN